MGRLTADRFIETLRKFPLWLRTTIGILLVCFGFLGFLPIVGFWMIPLGLIVLSLDYRIARYLYVNFRLLIRRIKRLGKRKSKRAHSN